MAQLIHKDKVVEVKDGDNLREAGEQIGIPFSCEQGYCGTCWIDVLEGDENLSELSPDEDNLGMDRKRRLACQCKIKQGKVKVDF